ncbi:hypothetical protein [Pedobacter immunditicola]|uniref:hypothetical protein n=1 Tax=Pedobacter immunditicola TaxID=3133440 RepID=UPI00309A9D7F
MENFNMLKKVTLLFLLTVASHQLQAQSDEQIRNKSNGYLEKQQSRQRIRSINQIEIDKNMPDKKTLYIIDDKIFSGTAEELNKAKLEKLNLVHSVKDTTSTSGIHYILIFRTKRG